ncbi:uncharacterized protein LOC129757198 [Uranotaenia lowii]|uniref:uncharacterized protein LOC129757198 n=1 Tax=Uranotaenia lowii TaxID=190385 RepID=UPI0024786671|nr:uncharacterized protein LOC129757198 [Uranotaenia lowii]XP_055610317.1 uncharacterized protein LOC129757198 [Uranotaenia lowii]XP_055610323.1 uncharacterized protein LOC129757198 [Uranotaenia lowii]XP_055610333.1 uncharacterized protein LOC129757198 [Uranotaenia lowii]XP_055610338.1 uncharacterized protein LOC129757198 [Uranotaenia lowii]
MTGGDLTGFVEQFGFYSSNGEYNGSIYDDLAWNETHRYIKTRAEAQLDVTYAVFEGLVALMAVVGNAMVIVVFKRERRLRRRTNFYIVSLAAADFLVGLLGVPFAVLSSVGLPRNLHACLFTISLLIVLCTISIFCLVAVSVDRYWAILHPMAYSRNVRTKTAIVIISLCWLAGSIIGFLPLFGWHETPQEDTCLFLKVMDYDYLVFLYFATIITPALVMLAFYAHIYRVIVRQLRQIVTMNPSGGLSSDSRRSSESSRIRVSTMKSCKSGRGGTMLRVLGAAQKREVKATQNLSIIVMFFMVCWIPLYTINFIVAFCRDCRIPSTLMFFCIILSHLNSAVNPLLYAYHLKDFRAALRNLIMSMLGYDVTTQELNYRASLASQQQQFAQRHSIVDKRLSLQPKVYIDSPVYHRTQQQLRQQQSKLLQQRSLERSESGASFQSFNKKRLISTTRSEPGSPNVIVSNSAVNASPAGSTCSSPSLRYEMSAAGGLLLDVTASHRGKYEMWGIAEVSSINEDSGLRKSLDNVDDNGDDRKDNDELADTISVEVEISDCRENEMIDYPSDRDQLPHLCYRLTEEDRNLSSLYNIVMSKRRSHSTCCILNVPSSNEQHTFECVYLIESHSPTRILQSPNNNVVNKTNHIEKLCTNPQVCSLSRVDNENNNCNQHHYSKHASSPNFSSYSEQSGDYESPPVSKSFSLFNSANNGQSLRKSQEGAHVDAKAANIPPTTHSSLLKSFITGRGADAPQIQHRIRSFKLNKRSHSNDK